MNSKFSGHVVRRAAGYTLLELLLALGFDANACPVQHRT